MDVHHRLIIRHPRDGGILAERETGDYTLPTIVSGDRHTAEVDYINAAVLAEFGLTTTVLRSLTHSDADVDPIVRVHDLQARGDVDARAGHARWVMPSATFAPPDRAALRLWRAHGAIVDGCEWTNPHWFGEACNWIERTLDAAGLGPIDSVVQLRVWASSCVLRVLATDAEYYFKALPSSGSRECGVTRHLATHFPDVLPRVIACEPGRRWLIMTACEGRKLEDSADAGAWPRAAARYGRLQADCVAHVPALRALGCPVHDLETLARRIEPLCNDTGALRMNQPEGLTAAEIDRLRGLVPTLRRNCEQLARAGIALTLEHGDLWPSNIFVDADHCAIIDWEDVMIAHPFFSLAPLSVGLRKSALYSPELLTRVESAYLAAFTGPASKARLRSALRLAAPLGFIDMAIRYRHQRPSVAALHPWMHDFVPQALRLALAGVDAGEKS
jgi:hypothetical protein